MDELTLTREMAAETSLPTAAQLAPARARLMAAARPSPWRKRLVIGTAGLVAAGVAAAFAIDARPHPSPPTMIPAAEFLDEAATVAAAGPDRIPRPDQFVYIHSRSDDSGTWYSIDGTHDGVMKTPGKPDEVIQGCRNHQAMGHDSSGNVTPYDCDPLPYYLADLPTTTDGMIAWLTKRNGYIDGKLNVNGIGKDLWEMASNWWLRPAQRAALYRAVGRIDGITLVPDAKDGSGRKGTGVAWAHDTSKPEVMWIFDSRTHVMLGAPNYSVDPPVLVNHLGDRQ